MDTCWWRNFERTDVSPLADLKGTLKYLYLTDNDIEDQKVLDELKKEGCSVTADAVEEEEKDESEEKDETTEGEETTETPDNTTDGEETAGPSAGGDNDTEK